MGRQYISQEDSFASAAKAQRAKQQNSKQQSNNLEEKHAYCFPHADMDVDWMKIGRVAEKVYILVFFPVGLSVFM